MSYLDAFVRLDDIALEVFHLKPEIARRKAALGQLPVPAVRLSGGRKGPFYIPKDELESFVAARVERAKQLNHRMRMAGAA